MSMPFLRWPFILMLCLLTVLADALPARAQQQTAPVRILRVYGSTTLEVNQTENYRARVNDNAARPVSFRWNMGDGTLAEGNNVVHRYERPGRYLVIVTARNVRGSDADSVYVTVQRPRTAVAGNEPAGAPEITRVEAEAQPAAPAARRSSPAETALRGRAGIQWADGGYTLLAATFTDQEAAEDHALALHRDGYRAGIMVDKKAGASTAYRVVVGQFGDADAAVTGRQEMLRNNRPGAWMVITLDSETTTVE